MLLMVLDVGTTRTGILITGGDDNSPIKLKWPLAVDSLSTSTMHPLEEIPLPPSEIADKENKADEIYSCLGENASFGIVWSQFFEAEWDKSLGISPLIGIPTTHVPYPRRTPQQARYSPIDACHLNDEAIKNNRESLEKYIKLIKDAYFGQETGIHLGRPSNAVPLSAFRGNVFHEATAALIGYSVMNLKLRRMPERGDIINGLGGEGYHILWDLGGGYLDFSLIHVSSDTSDTSDTFECLLEGSFPIGISVLFNSMQCNDELRRVGEINLNDGDRPPLARAYLTFLKAVINAVEEAICEKWKMKKRPPKRYLAGKSWEHLDRAWADLKSDMPSWPESLENFIPGDYSRIDTKILTTVGGRVYIKADLKLNKRPSAFINIDPSTSQIIIGPQENNLVHLNKLVIDSLDFQLPEASYQPHKAVKGALEQHFKRN